METTAKRHPRQTFSPEVFKRTDGADYTFGASGQWQALFVFRGQHCPICKAYLGKIEERRGSFEKLGVAVAAVSADPEVQTRVTVAAGKQTFPILYGMDTLCRSKSCSRKRSPSILSGSPTITSRPRSTSNVIRKTQWRDVGPKLVMEQEFSALGPWQENVDARLAAIPELIPAPQGGANCGA